MEPRQASEIFGQRRTGGHARPIDQYGDDFDRGGLTQRGGNLEPHIIVRVIEAAGTLLLACPITSDDNQAGTTFRNAPMNYLNEIVAGLDGIDVTKYAVLSKSPRKVVVEPACVGTGVIPAIAQENLRAAFQAP